TVAFGEAATATFSPEAVYPEGSIDIPYAITNTGVLTSSFDTLVTLSKVGAGIAFSQTIPVELTAGAIQSGLVHVDSLTAGSYTLHTAEPFGSGDTAFSVLPR